MNVYDEAHSLARAIKESEEFKHYENSRLAVNAKPELAQMIKDFQTKQFEMQAKQVMGEEVPAEMTQELQNIYGILLRDPLTAEYLQNQMVLSVMVNDVYKIIGEAVGVTMPGQ